VHPKALQLRQDPGPEPASFFQEKSSLLDKGNLTVFSATMKDSSFPYKGESRQVSPLSLS